MLKIMNLNDIKNIPYNSLRNFISEKVKNWIDEYSIESLDEIGCFVILEADEKELFEHSEMEFTETLHLGNETYLHGVKMIGDCYGEDIFLFVEDVRK